MCAYTSLQQGEHPCSAIYLFMCVYIYTHDFQVKNIRKPRCINTITLSIALHDKKCNLRSDVIPRFGRCQLINLSQLKRFVCFVKNSYVYLVSVHNAKVFHSVITGTFVTSYYSLFKIFLYFYFIFSMRYCAC